MDLDYGFLNCGTYTISGMQTFYCDWNRVKKNFLDLQVPFSIYGKKKPFRKNLYFAIGFLSSRTILSVIDF